MDQRKLMENQSTLVDMAKTQTNIQEMVTDMHSNQTALEKRVNKIEDKLATLQIHLDTLPELIARALRSQLQPEMEYRPSSGGHITPSASSGPRPLSEFTGLRRFQGSGAARQRRPFQTQASFGGFSNVATHYYNTPEGGPSPNLTGPNVGSDSQL
ncbi:hypothetical protein V1264_001897 [Littorina saxatilis]|uniref:Uncharacterized protein n=2 Tax=Littorina saxatilis TaxID=31220 RepID=A0AAN9C875_9CAEN